MLDNVNAILNVMLPSTAAEYNSYERSNWQKQHEQMQIAGGYGQWIPLGNCEPSLDMVQIFRSHGHFTDWELGLAGYASNYISTPRNVG